MGIEFTSWEKFSLLDLTFVCIRDPFVILLSRSKAWENIFSLFTTLDFAKFSDQKN